MYMCGCGDWYLIFTKQWMALQQLSGFRSMVFRHHVTIFNLWALFGMFEWEYLVGKEWSLHTNVFKCAVMKCYYLKIPHKNDIYCLCNATHYFKNGASKLFAL